VISRFLSSQARLSLSSRRPTSYFSLVPFLSRVAQIIPNYPTMALPNLSPSSDRSSNVPRLPVELLLDIISYADQSTLAILSLVDLTFLELVTPLIYQTAHIDDLPLPDTPRTPRLAELVPSLALSSVRTLHITPSNDGPPLPRLDLPKLVHLHIHHCCPLWDSMGYTGAYTSFNKCAELLSNLDPALLTFQLRQPSSSRVWTEWSCPENQDGWTRWLMSRTRLRELVFRGGTLGNLVRREGDEPLPNESVRLTFDVRRATHTQRGGDTYHWSDISCWPRDVGKKGLWEAPLRQISFRTSSPTIRRIIQADLDDGLEQLARRPSGTGVDKAGRTFQKRVEVTLEDDGPEWDEEEAELDFWRSRGQACGPEMEDVLYPEVEEESSVSDS
jgi:hypothetical protein